MVVTTNSENETILFGKSLSEALFAGSVVYLSGELGSGKTQVVKGMAQACDVDPSTVQSPAYDLIHEYLDGTMPIFHMDFYRLEHLAPEEHEWIREYADRGGVIAIEWAENVPDGIFKEYLHVNFKPYGTDGKREIEVSAVGEKYQEVLDKLS